MNSLEKLLEFRREVGIGEMERHVVSIKVHGGLCDLEFEPGISTGSANPGIGFTMKSESNRAPWGPRHDGRWHSGMGCIALDDARRLRDMLNWFIEKHL